ncbi:MAG: carbamoyl-phosphate synthase small subunit [Eggerthella lenta]
MSEISKRLMQGTSKPAGAPAALVLEDGAVFRGTSCAAAGEVFGEVCFNTSLEGYLEVITDPSYAGQIVTMTYPQIGNYGVNVDDAQADEPALRGLVVRDLCATPSNWRSAQGLPDYLRDHGVVASKGWTPARSCAMCATAAHNGPCCPPSTWTRPAFWRKCARAHPSSGRTWPPRCRARVRAASRPTTCRLRGRSRSPRLPSRASKWSPTTWSEALHPRKLVRAGCGVTCVPWDTPAAEVLTMAPDGVFLSNGPGDPEAVEGTYAQVEQLLGKVPVFGICLGHQMIAKAAGADIEKLKFGHRGGNHPVMNLRTRRVEITAQNHGFGLVFPSLGALVPELSAGVCTHEDDLRCWARRGVAPVVQNERFGRIQLTHVNLNDGTAEGVAFLDIPAFSVQYHPEASPGPTDAHYLFAAFARLMDSAVLANGGVADAAAAAGTPSCTSAAAGRTEVQSSLASGQSGAPAAPSLTLPDPRECANYLDIDIAEDRLAGWSFAEGKEASHA